MGTFEDTLVELSSDEIAQVGGAGFFSDLGRWFGNIYGRGARMQQRVDALENTMLGAMQYGA